MKESFQKIITHTYIYVRRSKRQKIKRMRQKNLITSVQFDYRENKI